MANIKNLTIRLQSGTTSTLFATWEFESENLTVTSATIKKGDVVQIASGSKYYNGVDIPDWVESEEWVVSEVSGDRVVLGKSADGKHNIVSPINLKDLANSHTTKDTLDHYSVTWRYATGDGIWFMGESSETTERYALYDIPSNATEIKITVKPVAKTYKVSGTERSYWTGTNTSATYKVAVSPPDVPSAPTITVERYSLTASLHDIEDARADKIVFEIYRGSSDEVHYHQRYKTVECTVKNRSAIGSCKLEGNYYYTVRCRAAYGSGKQFVYSDWSPFSEIVRSAPNPVADFTCSIHDETSVLLKWTAGYVDTSYEIQYNTDQYYFDKSDVSSVTVERGDYRTQTRIISGLDIGEKWYFRIRAINEQGNSDWSDIIYTIIGSKPAPPTTWSSSNTGIVGEILTLYWVHNSEDGSSIRESTLETTINGRTTEERVPYPEDMEPGAICSCLLDLSEYADGTEILWRVKTKGIADEYSDYSTQRSVTIYAPPTIELHLGEDMYKWLWDTFNFETDTINTAATGEYIECFPYDIKALSGPKTGTSKAQIPVCYHVDISAENTHTAFDEMGNERTVIAGTSVYSKTFYTSDYNFKMELLAGDVTLENDQSYKVTVTVTMNSGLSASDSEIFTVNWYQYLYDPDAELAVDKNTLSVYITPFCLNEYTALNDDVVMSVYRREYDGSFTEIATDLENNGLTTVVDPHPALDYARYRIVARNKNTSVSGFTDIPAMPIKEPSIVIQWDEKWSEFDYTEDAEPETKPWTGSMLRLPYNVDISEKYAPDVSLIKYIGRENPVAYYGTQRGETASWSTVVPKSDKETIYALRRLSKWRGNAYVREPSGVGYWATITVTMTINHRQLTVPVSFTITRVEGDM